MPLPASWVDPLMAKLTLRYGQAWMRQYADLDPAMVKADWAEVLGGFDRHPEALRYALDNLPEMPPNALQFRALARRSAPPVAVALPGPGGDAPPARVSGLARKLRAQQGGVMPAQRCIDAIERIAEQRGGRLSEPQRHTLAHCLRVPGTSTRLTVRAAIVDDEVPAC